MDQLPDTVRLPILFPPVNSKSTAKFHPQTTLQGEHHRNLIPRCTPHKSRLKLRCPLLLRLPIVGPCRLLCPAQGPQIGHHVQLQKVPLPLLVHNAVLLVGLAPQSLWQSSSPGHGHP
jgi:hypothetical protein